MNEYQLELNVDREVNIDLFTDLIFSPNLVTQTIIKYKDRPLMKSETFYAVAGQTVFAPLSFSATQYSRVYRDGYRTTTGYSINGGCVVFTIGVGIGTEIIIDEN